MNHNDKALLNKLRHITSTGDYNLVTLDDDSGVLVLDPGPNGNEYKNYITGEVITDIDVVHYDTTTCYVIEFGSHQNEYALMKLLNKKEIDELINGKENSNV